MQKVQQLISDHLNIWTTAEGKKKSGRGQTSALKKKLYGIQKLRELILGLALSGKLIFEKDTDIPTTNVLNDIEIEINKLTKKGLLGKRKILAPINEEEKSIKLPTNWVWTRLGNTGKIFHGDSINKDEKDTKYTNIKEGRPYIATKDVGYGREKINYKNGISIPYNISKFKVAHKDAVLICSEGGSAGKKIGITEFDIYFGNKLIANETFSAINPRFIFYVYQSQSFYKSFFKRMTGIIGGISMNEFLNIPIPIPPFKRQNEIVIKIDELMTLCDQLEQKHINSKEAHVKLVKVLLNTLTESKDAEEFKDNWQRIADHFDILFTTEDNVEELKKVIFQLAVMGKIVPHDPNDQPASGLLEKIKNEKKKKIKKNVKNKKNIVKVDKDQKPFNIPKSWEWVRLSDISGYIQYGLNDSANHINKDTLLLRITDIQKDHVNWSNVPGCSTDTKELKNYLLCENDILVARTGGTIGKSYLVKDLIKDSVFASYLIRIGQTNNINPKFKKIFFGSKLYWDQLYEYSKGTGQPNVSGTSLKNLLFSLPPLEEQNRIVMKVEELIVLCDKLKTFIKLANIKQKQISDEFISLALN